MTPPILDHSKSHFFGQLETFIDKNSMSVISTVIPSIHDPHPSIKIEELPRALQYTAKRIKMVDLNLLELFYTQTHCNLINLASLVPSIDLDSIYMQFSIILGLVREANMISESLGEKAKIFENQLKERLCVLLPQFAQGLLQLWREICQQMPALTEKMGSGKKAAVEDQCQHVSEAFDYLAAQLSEKKCQFELFNTASIHIEQPNENVRSQHEWLELMLRYTQASCKWYDRHAHFWTICDFHEDTANYDKRLELVQKLIKYRLDSQSLTPKILVQFYQSLSVHLNKIGNMHTYALKILDSFPKQQILDPLGWSESIKKLMEKSDLEKENALFYQLLIPNWLPKVIKLDSRRIIVLQAMQSASLADAMKSSRIKIERNILQAIIQEAKSVSQYFINIKNDLAKVPVFSSGAQQFSFSDMGIHIENITTILEELIESSDDNAAAILFTLQDLKGSVCGSLNQGVEFILKTLQEIYQVIENEQTRKKKIDPELIDKVIGNIQCATEMMASLGSTTPKLNKFLYALIEGKLPQDRKERDRKKRNPKGSAAKQKKTISRKRQTKPDSSEKKSGAKAEKQESAIDLTEKTFSIVENKPDPKETISITKATQILKEATAKLQNSLAEAAQEGDFSEKAYSIHNVKWKTLCKELANAGFILKRSSGSHHHYQHPKAKEVGIATVPVNSKDSLSTGVVKNIRSQIKRVHDKN